MDNVLENSVAVLRITPARWEQLVKNLPAELLFVQPKTGEWSAVECLAHLIDTERHIFPQRVQAILAGEAFSGFDPDTMSTQVTSATAAEALGMAMEFSRLRNGSLALLARVSPSDLERRGHHSELGPVTLAELVNEWAAHDLMHTVQAERALMQPYIHGSGPWLVYFKEHLAQP